LITGQAGSGKGRVMQALGEANRRSGKRVLNFAMTNKVVADMQAMGFTSQTLAMTKIQAENGKIDWDANVVIGIDEAAQDSHQQFEDMFKLARKHGAKVRLHGDDAQLPSIERGGMFTLFERRFGSAHLDEVMRTKDAEQKRMFGRMHDGGKKGWEDAVQIMRDSGSIAWSDSQEDSMAALAADYARDYLARPKDSRLIVAPRNDQVKALNDHVQKLRKDAGELGRGMTMMTSKGPVEFRIGDRIVMNETPNQKDKKKGLYNGAFGFVTGMTQRPDGKQQMSVDLNRPKGQQRRAFTFTVGLDAENKEVGGVGLGYASTVYKAQGSTLDRLYYLHDPAASSATNYVAMSRHRDRARLYASREDTPDYQSLAKQMGHGKKKTAAHAYVVADADRPKLETARQEIHDERTREFRNEQIMRTVDRAVKKVTPEGLRPYVGQGRQRERSLSRSS
jgi:ATP-dependent exoDNAse (exonuclease V) alpha subunit